GPRGLLLRPPVLEEAERWIAARPANAPEPTEATKAFIVESRYATTRRRNILTASLGAGLVIALALAGLAYWQREVAVAQRTIAVKNEQRAIAGEDLARRNEAQANEQRDRALLTQSRFLAGLAKQQADSGDLGHAMLLALEALPDKNATAEVVRSRP